MILQFTPEELGKLMQRHSQWYYDCLTYILSHANFDRFASYSGQTPAQQLHDLRIKYEQDNPKPDWKTLL